MLVKIKGEIVEKGKAYFSGDTESFTKEATVTHSGDCGAVVAVVVGTVAVFLTFCCSQKGEITPHLAELFNQLSVSHIATHLSDQTELCLFSEENRVHIYTESSDDQPAVVFVLITGLMCNHFGNNCSTF